jgi:hypothetical protein
MDTGNHVEHRYSDSYGNPRNVVVGGAISVHDRYTASCYMKMNTKDMTATWKLYTIVKTLLNSLLI